MRVRPGRNLAANIAAPRALLLDALGTLVELPPPGPALREELSRRFGIEVSQERATRALGAEIAYYRRHYHQAGSPEAVAALRDRCAEVLRTALGPLSTLLSTSELLSALLGALRFRAFPDAAPAIRAAHAAGLRVVVASNWDVSLHELLDRLELGPLLDGVVTSAEAGAGKPAPEVFRRALRLAGNLAPSDAIHVGDSAVEDVQGALAAGLRAVLIRRDGAAGAAAAAVAAGVPIITTLSELPNVLGKPGH